MRAEERRERIEAVGEWRARLVSYRLGEAWICTADNVDPGANVARATAGTRDAAEAEALRIAAERIGRTRIVG